MSTRQMVLVLIAVAACNPKKRDPAASHANALHSLVALERKQLGTLKSAFEGAGNLKDHKVSAEVTAALAAADDELGRNRLKALSLRQDSLDAEVRGAVNLFYAIVVELHDLIADHLATVEYEEAAIKTNAALIERLGVKDSDTLSKASSAFKLGIMLTNPDDETRQEPQAARLVEIGAPLCGNDVATAKPSKSGACQESENVAGFLYRFDATTNLDGATDAWSKAKVLFPASLAPGDTFPNGQIILLQPSQMLDALGKGADGSFAAFAYYKRLSKIYDKLKSAYELGEALDRSLAQAMLRT